MELPASFQPFPTPDPGDRSVPSSPVIAIQNLNYYFGKGDLLKQSLFEINLSIAPGESVIIAGSPGSGKTTLLSLIGALRSVKAGSVEVLGHELNNATDRQLVQIRRKIGYVFQAHHLLPFMTVRQNVRLSMALQATPNASLASQKVDEILNAVDLGNDLDAYPAQLSAGQQQRVAIARALINRPALLLADEPTASLDREAGRDIVELMYRLAKEHRYTLFLATSDPDLLDSDNRGADRIIYLEEGKLQANPERSRSLVLVQSEQPADALDQAAVALIDPDPATDSESASLDAAALEIPQAEASPAKPYTIACIADNLATLHSLRAFLYDDIFSVILIQDPIQAFTEILKAVPDVVLMDIAMPKLDGYQLCTLLRQRKTLEHLPVIAMTDRPNALNVEQAKIAGITDFLVKPFDQTNLVVKLFPHLT